MSPLVLQLMGYIVTHFIPTLCDTSDASLAACVSRLQTYISQRQWLKEPKGRKMPRCAESSSSPTRVYDPPVSSFIRVHVDLQWVILCVLG